MTILPKKKPSQARSEVENASETSNHQHHPSVVVGAPTHITHMAAVTSHGQASDTLGNARWSLPSSSGHGSQSSSRYEDYDIDSGPSQTKRRMRVSPHRSIRPKHRERNERVTVNTSAPSCSSMAVPVVQTVSRPMSSSPTPRPGPSSLSAEDDYSGYNSGDEYGPGRSASAVVTEEEWERKERWFEKKMRKRGYVIKRMDEDGACLFRAVADQIYGDQEMHTTVRNQCMDHIAANSDYFSQYMTEDFNAYVSRKRLDHVHGNHIEIHALSEIYNRTIEVFCYSSEPINIFHGSHQTDNEPLRLSYHRGVHYNSIVDPYKATIGVGLGLPGLVPGQADKKLLGDAIRLSEDTHIEQAMFEDKIKATDWEATSEAIEEHVARESYLDWLRENERRSRQHRGSSGASSKDLKSPRNSASSSARNSPKTPIMEHGRKLSSASSSPRPSGSEENSARSPLSSPTAGTSSAGTSKDDWGLGPGFQLTETASFLGQLPPDMFGLSDWEDAGVLAQVLAASQQEYLDSLKSSQQKTAEESHPVSESDKEKALSDLSDFVSNSSSS